MLSSKTGSRIELTLGRSCTANAFFLWSGLFWVVKFVNAVPCVVESVVDCAVFNLFQGAILTTMLATRNFSIPKMDQRSSTVKKAPETVAGAVVMAEADATAALANSDTIVEEDGLETPKTPFAPTSLKIDNHIGINGHVDSGTSVSSVQSTVTQGNARKQDIIRVTQNLLDSISSGDYDTYS